MSAANPPSAIGEPRRVRTVPIRPDQGDAAAAPPSQQPTSVAPRQANAAAANAAAPASDDTARAAAARASSRTALRSTPPPAPATAGNAPLSLSPDANNNAPPPVAQANFPPPPSPRASTPPPARVASAPPPAASAGGSYLVQVSSQRSEAEAESAYRGIQSKFGSVLGSQPHTVRRADLGAKGVYYRAMVGPFASREEAVQVCSSLKQAGGDCVVQH
jgi:cell division septation protein DedD